jgi:hypothetical protein
MRPCAVVVRFSRLPLDDADSLLGDVAGVIRGRKHSEIGCVVNRRESPEQHLVRILFAHRLEGYAKNVAAVGVLSVHALPLDGARQNRVGANAPPRPGSITTDFANPAIAHFIEQYRLG